LSQRCGRMPAIIAETHDDAGTAIWYRFEALNGA